MKMRRDLLILSTLLCFGQASALEEPKICYILDAILFVYGIALTVLYCRLKMRPVQNTAGEAKKEKQEEGIYTGLTHNAQDTYETINIQKK